MTRKDEEAKCVRQSELDWSDLFRGSAHGFAIAKPSLANQEAFQNCLLGGVCRFDSFDFTGLTLSVTKRGRRDLPPIDVDPSSPDLITMIRSKVKNDWRLTARMIFDDIFLLFGLVLLGQVKMVLRLPLVVHFLNKPKNVKEVNIERDQNHQTSWDTFASKLRLRLSRCRNLNLSVLGISKVSPPLTTRMILKVAWYVASGAMRDRFHATASTTVSAMNALASGSCSSSGSTLEHLEASFRSMIIANNRSKRKRDNSESVGQILFIVNLLLVHPLEDRRHRRPPQHITSP
ncbi:unnamed protein product [Cyprideis torosa]|uniref:Uncharacterized protein n=1 Tax=Cyprideis torosa TaxID=163714 RepID=A0A7R8WBQ0_9CRUS|nr:unnamed protein product [Cyprideis torosa]CAG0886696.1 unnamed protein product [Cyprideis torosa]